MGHARSFLIVLTLLVAWCSLLPPAYAQPVGYEGYQVVRVEITDEPELDTLRGLLTLHPDFELWSEALGIGPMDVRVAPEAVPLLDAVDLCYDVLIADLQKHIDELYGVHDGRRGGDFFDVLRTYDEHVRFMTDLAAAYPDLTEMINLGLSVEGRPLWALRITGPGEDKPGVLYHGAQHGNEQAGASVVAYAAYYILTNYDSDPDVAVLVDNVEWFLLPIMNPDGYVAYQRYNANGVDLNRNWGGPGSGESPYGGPYPFSEPETAAMRDFLLAHTGVRVHIDFHGYINMLLWPWGHTRRWCQDHWTFHILGSEAQSLILDAGGGYYEIGPGNTTLYPTSGTSTDYSYGELSLWALTFEIAYPWLPDVCEHFLPTMLFLSGWVSDCNENGIPDADEIADGACEDCNLNGVPDECESQEDCNGDGVLDICDFAGGVDDCDGNAIPDICDPDCNANGLADFCDIRGGTSADCNENDVPDECDITFGDSDDYDLNGVPDECEDCNENGIPDGCELDCDAGDCATHPLGCGTGVDCNGNRVPDECDIADATSHDDNDNGIPDECDCPGDLNHDWVVNLIDLSGLLVNYGQTSGAAYLDGDFDCDGDVDLGDLAELLGHYGTVCE
jgi:hypothetical protein